MLRTASTRRPATSPWATHDTTGRPRHATVPGVAQLGPAAVAPATIVRRCLVLLALALVAAPPATAVASPPCPGIRFLVAPALVPRTELPFDAIVIDADGMATITSGCPPVPAHVRRRGGRRLRRGPGLRRMRVRERVVHRERGGPEEDHHDLDVDDEHLVEHVLERQLEQLDLHHLVDIDDETDDHLYLHLDLGDDDLE